MSDKSSRPAIVNSLLEGYGFAGKRIILFATSGGSGFGKTAGKDAKAAHGAQMKFPVGAPNDGFAQYFTGQSFLAPLSTSQVGIFNVAFEPGCRNNWHIHHADKGGGQILVCVAGRNCTIANGQPCSADGYRLSTESEWEYVCRAMWGNSSRKIKLLNRLSNKKVETIGSIIAEFNKREFKAELIVSGAGHRAGSLI